MAVPLSTVKAVTSGSGTLTLSQSSGIPVWNSYYKDFGDWITVTGTGFPSGQDNVQIVLLPSTTSITATVANYCTANDVCDLGSNTLDNTAQGYFNPSIEGDNFGTVMTDANGWFKAQVATPVVQGGDYLVYAIYPTSTGNVVTTAVPFTVKAAIFIVSDFTGATSSGVGDAIQLAGVGFNNGEQIQPIPSSFFTNGLHPTITTGVNPGVSEGTFDDGPETTTNNLCGAGGAFCVGALVGGSHTLTILGLSSGTSASQPFIITPTLFFKEHTCTNPIYSIDTGAGAKVCVSGSGFAKSATVAAAGSVTIGGVTTIHGEIDSDANGNFPNTVITLAQSAGVGPLNVVLGGTTFSYANGNIYQPNPQLFDSFAGVLIGSHAGQGALLTLPEGNARRVGQTGAIIGYGYAASLTYANTGPFVLQDKNGPHSYPFLTPAMANGGDATDATGTDANGAFMYWYTTPTMQHFKFNLHDNTPGGNASPDSTYTINPDVRFENDDFGNNVASAGDYVDLVPATHGGLDTQNGLTTFGASTTPLGDLTVYVNGNLWDSCNTDNRLCDGNIAANGAFVNWVYLARLAGSGIASTDLPMGTYNVNVTGSYNGDWAFTRYKIDNAMGTVSQLTIDPIALNGALSTTSGSAGTTVALQTGQIGCGGCNNPGIHGLSANTQYNIMWDSTTQVGTFTSTATGGVPVGTQFTIPAGTSGVHVIDLQTTSGTSALWGQVEDHYNDQFANMEFTLTTSLIVTPSVASGGTVMTLTGNGLPASTQLYLTNCASGITYAQFTSDSSGQVPSGVTFAVPQLPSPGPETGALVTWQIDNNKGCYQGPNPVGLAKFVYDATMSLSSTAGAAGTTLTASASGLANGGVYDIVFNYAPLSTNLNAYTGSIVGVIIANGQGQGTSQITIPASAAAGTYNVGLVSTCPGNFCAPYISASATVINVIPTFTVGGAVQGGAQFTISGTPVQQSLGGTPVLSVTYNNPGTTQVTGFVIVSVQNALGQTVYITTATIHPAAGASDTGVADLAPMASGSYTATVFVISASGGSLSAPTTGVAIHV
ncbi:MAG TPA: hypothetical protein VKF15_00410 [Nitrososphaerales archaeon]|nr:hypothetical protein [Nitrososphaerales archaeon]